MYSSSSSSSSSSGSPPPPRPWIARTAAAQARLDAEHEQALAAHAEAAAQRRAAREAASRLPAAVAEVTGAARGAAVQRFMSVGFTPTRTRWGEEEPHSAMEARGVAAGGEAGGGVCDLSTASLEAVEVVGGSADARSALPGPACALCAWLGGREGGAPLPNVSTVFAGGQTRSMTTTTSRRVTQTYLCGSGSRERRRRRRWRAG